MFFNFVEAIMRKILMGLLISFTFISNVLAQEVCKTECEPNKAEILIPPNGDVFLRIIDQHLYLVVQQDASATYYATELKLPTGIEPISTIHTETENSLCYSDGKNRFTAVIDCIYGEVCLLDLVKLPIPVLTKIAERSFRYIVRLEWTLVASNEIYYSPTKNIPTKVIYARVAPIFREQQKPRCFSCQKYFDSKTPAKIDLPVVLSRQNDYNANKK